MTLDRAEFEAQKARKLAEQATDQELFDLGREFVVESGPPVTSFNLRGYLLCG